jgi:hypothetical protein
MLLKLRRKRPRQRPRAAASTADADGNLLIQQGIYQTDTAPSDTARLAADVHLCSVENYRETPLCRKRS